LSYPKNLCELSFLVKRCLTLNQLIRHVILFKRLYYVVACSVQPCPEHVKVNESSRQPLIQANAVLFCNVRESLLDELVTMPRNPISIVKVDTFRNAIDPKRLLRCGFEALDLFDQRIALPCNDRGTCE
jgi:hypothetical protein